MKARSVVALSGGIGGAKLALGLYRTLPRRTFSLIVNTADDFDYLGLRICPDLDTTLYTLAGVPNPDTGWGRSDETWTFMTVLATLGGETWFRVGDGDLALHVERTRRLAAGEPLSAIIEDVARRFQIAAAVIPATDDPVRTRVVTPGGDLTFQDYFVRQRCEPRVASLRFDGAGAASPAVAAKRALESASLAAVIICPSNPYLSIDPILAVPGMRTLLQTSAAPVVAVTPLIDGRAVKGPTAKIMGELGIEASPLSVAQHYRGLIDGFVLDVRDRALKPRFDVPVYASDTFMATVSDRERLAREVFEFALSLGRSRLRIS